MKLPKEKAIDAACGDAPEGFEIAVDRVTDSSRWSVFHELILKDLSGRFWGCTYSRGATEYQDESPFEYEGDEIEFLEYEMVNVPTLRRKK